MDISLLTKIYSGITLILLATVETGGLFLLQILKGKFAFTGFQNAMFRAGHAHAGVLSILCLVAQLLTDATGTSKQTEYLLRTAFVVAALLVSVGFFIAAVHKNATAPNRFIIVLYTGAVILAISLVGLGILLLG